MHGTTRTSFVQGLTTNTMRGLLVGALAVGYALCVLAVDALHSGLGLAGGESTVDTLGLLASAADYTVSILLVVNVASVFVAAVEAWQGRILSLMALSLLAVPGYILAVIPSALPQDVWLSLAVITSVAVVATACLDQARALIGDNWLRRAMLRSFCTYAVVIIVLGLVVWLRIAPNAVRDLKYAGDLGGAASIVFDFARTPVETADGDKGILISTGGQSAVVLQPSCSTDLAASRLRRLSDTDLTSLPRDTLICPDIDLR